MGVLTVRSKMTNLSGHYTGEELYHAEAVANPGGVVYLVRNDKEHTDEFGEKNFKALFELVKQDPSAGGRPSMGTLRQPLSDDDLETMADAARLEGVSAYRQQMSKAYDSQEALQVGLKVIFDSLTAKHLFTQDEAGRLSSILSSYPLDAYLDEHRAPHIVQRLLDGAPAPQVMNESDTYVRRGPETRDELVVDVGEPYAGDWGNGPRMGQHERSVLSALKPGQSTKLVRGWSVMREPRGYTFTNGTLTGFVDERAISPFIRD